MSETKEKLISVIVPVYNTERFLPACLNSLSAQQGDDIEFILINDGSTDASPSLLAAFAAQDNRAQVLQKRNGGVSAARNDGLAAATGRFICFLDSDDMLSAQFAERVRPYLTESHDVVFFSWMNLPSLDMTQPVGDIPSGDHTCTSKGLQTIILNSLCPSQALLKTPMRFRGSRGVWGMVFSTDIIKNNAIRFRDDMRLAEDAAFRLKYLAHCSNAVCLSDALYFYRVSETSLLHKYDANVDQSVFLTLSVFRDIIARDYGDSDVMLSRYFSAVILESRFYLLKYLFNASCTLPSAERLTLYEAFRRHEAISQAIEKCDRDQMQSPIDLLLDAYRIKDANLSMQAAKRALAPKRSLKTLAAQLGILPFIKKLLGRFR